MIVRVYTGDISPHKAHFNEINFSCGTRLARTLIACLGRAAAAAATTATAIHSTANHLPFVLHSFPVV